MFEKIHLSRAQIVKQGEPTGEGDTPQDLDRLREGLPPLDAEPMTEDEPAEKPVVEESSEEGPAEEDSSSEEESDVPADTEEAAPEAPAETPER